MNGAPPHIASGQARRYYPAAENLEREVLGACMLDETACAQAIQMIDPEYLAGRSKKHHQIFETIRALFSAGTPVNLSTVSEHGGDLDQMYLTDLLDEVASTSNVEHHCLIITEKWIERRALDELRRAVANLQGGEKDIFELLEELQHSLSGLVVGRSKQTHIRHAVEEAMRRVEEWRAGEATDFTPSGFYSLDRKFGGFPVGELTTFAAQSGAGKTSWIAQCLAAQAQREAKQKTPRAVLLFSAEMSGEQIAHRIASNWSASDLRVIRTGKASDEAYAVYDKSLGRLGRLLIHIDDSPAPTMAHIAARCQQVLVTDGLAFVAVDYDEKVNSEGATEELRVSAIAQGMKNLAKRFEVPVVSLSQYSKDAENHYGVPSDRFLRYSGKKLQESALVLHWYWPGYWIENKGVSPEQFGRWYDESQPNRGFLICTKNRFGAAGKIPLDFVPQITKFIDHGEPSRHGEKAPF